MTLTAAQIRVREDAVDVRWALFIDGIAYTWTTDLGQSGSTIRGSGFSTWLGESEDAIGGVEVAGARTMLGGLEVPPSLRMGVDIKSGEIEPAPATFRLHDVDGVIGPLFAREGKAYDVLRQRIAAGTTATAATLLGPGGGSIAIWDRYVGLERIGPAGERRLFPCLPYSLVGFEHAVHQDAPLPGELPPILVSDEPLAWAGRLVTLYAIYRDPTSREGDYQDWPLWDAQHAAGNLAWVGVLRGVTRQRGRVYELECHGIDALFRKQLGVVSSATWQPVTAEINYGSGEDTIAIGFTAHFSDGSVPDQFDGSIFDRTLTATTKSELIAEIDGFIQDAYDGTSQNYTTGGAGDLDVWTVAAAAQDAAVGLDADGFYVRKNTQAADQTFLVLWIAMHSRVWRQLGFEPETQNFDAQHEGATDTRQIKFKKLVNGEPYSMDYDTGEVVPASGYWRARMTTVALEFTEDTPDSNEWDNDGARRYYAPKFDGEPYTLDMDGGGQIIRLGGDANPYIEGQLTVYHSGADVDGSASERARYFAFRGKVLREIDGEPEDLVQVAICEWNEGNRGTINVGATGVQPALRLIRWLDPRTFGFNHRPLGFGVQPGGGRAREYWVGFGDGEGKIEACPLHAYAYLMDDTPEYAHNVLTQLMLSTGSGGGYTTGGAITAGDNSPGVLAGDLFFGDDLELADLGLAIPYQLVADLETIRAAFDTVPGGWGGPLNRVRHAYLGPFQAVDVISSLIRPRRLLMSLHGQQLGVVSLSPFSPELADVTLLERDLYPDDPSDPRSLVPEQLPAPLGHLDGIKLSYRWDPAEKRTQLEQLERSRDPDARSRTGDLIEEITDHGLMPFSWGLTPDGIGVAAWYDELRQLWAYDAATFFGLEHFALRLTVSRPKGQDLRPGTRVLLSNPWPVDSAGDYGITNHVGIVTSVEVDTATHARRVEVFVFAGQAAGIPYFAPSVRILDQSGSSLTVSTDQYAHGDANVYDAQGFIEPSWSTVGGRAQVQVVYRIGMTWTAGSTHEAVSYSAGTLALDSTPTTSVEYADRWVLMRPYDNQASPGFVRTLFGAIVLDTLQHGATPTDGRPFQP